MKKTILLLCVFTFFLAACNKPNPDMSDLDMNGQDTTKSEGYTLNDTTITNNNTNQEKVSMNKNSNVKDSVSDFADIKAKTATITTTKGDLTIELYREETPVTTANFLDLASKGFYDGIVFHRVIPDFMAQVGDPLTKDETKQAMWGTGGPGYTIIDEFNSALKHDSAGVLSMANVGQPNTGGSQIFMTFEPTPWLDGKHTVFGKITEGLDVLEKIEQGDKIISIKY